VTDFETIFLRQAAKGWAGESTCMDLGFLEILFLPELRR